MTKIDAVQIARELIQINSTTGDEAVLCQSIGSMLEDDGWILNYQRVAHGRVNLLACRPEFKKPRLIFSSHLDTVPPFVPFNEDDEYLYGRGACDPKGSIAAQLVAAHELLAEGCQDIGLLYVVGEEDDHCGMKKANDLELNPRFLIVGEPTNSKFASSQKGILKLQLNTIGKAAHSGYPHEGVSAIEKLIDVLNDLRQYTWPKSIVYGQTTLNIGKISGGDAANVVPPSASAALLFRISTAADTVLKEVEEVLAGRGEISNIMKNDPALLNVIQDWPSEVVAFFTDVPYFEFTGKAFLWGPGSILDAHTEKEKVKKSDIVEAVESYKKMALTLLKK